MQNIYVYTAQGKTRQIMQMAEADLALLKDTYQIFNHTYSEQVQGDALFVFLTPAPITDTERGALIDRLTPELPLLSIGVRIWLSEV